MENHQVTKNLTSDQIDRTGGVAPYSVGPVERVSELGGFCQGTARSGLNEDQGAGAELLVLSRDCAPTHWPLPSSDR